MSDPSAPPAPAAGGVPSPMGTPAAPALTSQQQPQAAATAAVPDAAAAAAAAMASAATLAATAAASTPTQAAKNAAASGFVFSSAPSASSSAPPITAPGTNVGGTTNASASLAMQQPQQTSTPLSGAGQNFGLTQQPQMNHQQLLQRLAAQQQAIGQSMASSASAPKSPMHAGANSMFGAGANVNPQQLLGMGGGPLAGGIGGGVNTANQVSAPQLNANTPPNISDFQRQLRIQQLQMQQRLLQQGASPQQAIAAVANATANNPLSIMNSRNTGGLGLAQQQNPQGVAPGVGGPLGGLPQPTLGANQNTHSPLAQHSPRQAYQSSPNASPTIPQKVASPQSGTTPAVPATPSTPQAQAQAQYTQSSSSSTPVANTATAPAGTLSPALTAPGTPPTSMPSALSSSSAMMPMTQQPSTSGGGALVGIAPPQLGQGQPQATLQGLAALHASGGMMSTHAPQAQAQGGAGIAGMLSPRASQPQLNIGSISGTSTPVGASSPRASDPAMLPRLLQQLQLVRANMQQLQQMAQQAQAAGQQPNPAITERLRLFQQKSLQYQAQIQQAQQQQLQPQAPPPQQQPPPQAAPAPAAAAAPTAPGAPPLTPIQVNGVLSQPMPSATNTQEFAKHFIMFQQVRMSLLAERTNLARKRTVLEEERKSLTDEHKRLVEMSTMSTQQEMQGRTQLLTQRREFLLRDWDSYRQVQRDFQERYQLARERQTQMQKLNQQLWSALSQRFSQQNYQQQMATTAAVGAAAVGGAAGQQQQQQQQQQLQQQQQQQQLLQQQQQQQQQQQLLQQRQQQLAAMQAQQQQQQNAMLNGGQQQSTPMQQGAPGQTPGPAAAAAAAASTAEWSQQETTALLEFVAARGFSHWQSLSEDPVLRVRHTDPEDCRRHFNHIYQMARKNQTPATQPAQPQAQPQANQFSQQAMWGAGRQGAAGGALGASSSSSSRRAMPSRSSRSRRNQRSSGFIDDGLGGGGGDAEEEETDQSSGAESDDDMGDGMSDGDEEEWGAFAKRRGRKTTGGKEAPDTRGTSPEGTRKSGRLRNSKRKNYQEPDEAAFLAVAANPAFVQTKSKFKLDRFLATRLARLAKNVDEDDFDQDKLEEMLHRQIYSRRHHHAGGMMSPRGTSKPSTPDKAAAAAASSSSGAEPAKSESSAAGAVKPEQTAAAEPTAGAVKPEDASSAPLAAVAVKPEGDATKPEGVDATKSESADAAAKPEDAAAAATSSSTSSAHDALKEQMGGLDLSGGSGVTATAAQLPPVNDESESDSDEEAKKAAEPIDGDAIRYRPGWRPDEIVVVNEVGAEESDREADGSLKSAPVRQYLVRIEGYSYMRCVWLTVKQLKAVFGEQSIRSRVRNFEVKRHDIFAENESRWGVGVHFDPDLLRVERIIGSRPAKNPGSAPGSTEYLVLWGGGSSYLDATWESGYDLVGAPGAPTTPRPSVPTSPVAPGTPTAGAASSTSGHQPHLSRKHRVQNRRRMEDFNKFNTLPTDEQLHAEMDTALSISQGKKFVGPEENIFKGNHKLRDYQLAGLNWLVGKFHEDKNCILADEMGLGKTVQSVTFLNHLFSRLKIRGPFMVVVPLSTIGHWKREIEGWTDMNVVLYYDAKSGQKSRKMIRDHEFFYNNDPSLLSHYGTKFNILLTTYDVAMSDLEHFRELPWKYLVVDEGHRLKNKDTKLAVALSELNIERRLLLTGTPIQNNIYELWTLLNFLEPSVFETYEEFEERYGDVKTSDQVQKLQAELAPFILRRLKESVEKSIPPKQETLIDIELTTMQKKYYRAIYEKNRDFLVTGCENSKNVPRLMNVEMELRKCCNHPFLIEGVEYKEVPEECTWNDYYKVAVQASGKFVFLDKLLPRMKAEGHKVLIFSQMQKVLNLLQEYLRYRKYRFERLDGSVTGSERQNAIDRFCNPESDHLAFLLTTRAGGVGLNLAAADTVILFDSDWNPQQDLQAMARCHRIGQKNAVMVYRLVTKNTYEAQMFQRASLKLGLDQAVLSQIDREDGKLPEDEKEHLDRMLKHGAYALLDEDDSAAQKFCETELDDLLKTNAHVVAHTQKKDDDKPSLGGISFTKMNFESEQADASIDVNADDFWEKVLASAAKPDDGENDEAKSLMSKLDDLSKLDSSKEKNAYFKDLKTHVESMIAQRQSGDTSVDCVSTIALCTHFQSLETTFIATQRNQAKKWIDALGTRVRRQTQRTPLETTTWSGRITASSRRAATQKLAKTRRKLLNKDEDDYSGSDSEAASAAEGSDEDGSDLEFDAEELRDIKRRKLANPEEDGYTDLCVKCLKGGRLLLCDGVCKGAYHLKCANLKKPPKAARWRCETCVKKEHVCFMCRKAVTANPKKKEHKVTRCAVKMCGRQFHQECVARIKRTDTFYRKKGKFECPLHHCAKCKHARESSPHVVVCQLCPIAYHPRCLPYGFVRLVEYQGVCPNCQKDPQHKEVIEAALDHKTVWDKVKRDPLDVLKLTGEKSFRFKPRLYSVRFTATVAERAPAAATADDAEIVYSKREEKKAETTEEGAKKEESSDKMEVDQEGGVKKDESASQKEKAKDADGDTSMSDDASVVSDKDKDKEKSKEDDEESKETEAAEKEKKKEPEKLVEVAFSMKARCFFPDSEAWFEEKKEIDEELAKIEKEERERNERLAAAAAATASASSRSSSRRKSGAATTARSRKRRRSGVDHSEDSDEDVLISLTSNHRSSARKRTRTSTAAAEDDGALPDTVEGCLELLKPLGVKLGKIWCRYCGCRASLYYEKSPWSKKILCPNHSQAWAKGRLKLPKTEPEEVIDPSKNKDLLYLHRRILKERKHGKLLAQATAAAASSRSSSRRGSTTTSKTPQPTKKRGRGRPPRDRSQTTTKKAKSNAPTALSARAIRAAAKAAALEERKAAAAIAATTAAAAPPPPPTPADTPPAPSKSSSPKPATDALPPPPPQSASKKRAKPGSTPSSPTKEVSSANADKPKETLRSLTAPDTAPDSASAASPSSNSSKENNDQPPQKSRKLTEDSTPSASSEAATSTSSDEKQRQPEKSSSSPAADAAVSPATSSTKAPSEADSHKPDATTSEKSSEIDVVKSPNTASVNSQESPAPEKTPSPNTTQPQVSATTVQTVSPPPSESTQGGSSPTEKSNDERDVSAKPSLNGNGSADKPDTSHSSETSVDADGDATMAPTNGVNCVSPPPAPTESKSESEEVTETASPPDGEVPAADVATVAKKHDASASNGHSNADTPKENGDTEMTTKKASSTEPTPASAKESSTETTPVTTNTSSTEPTPVTTKTSSTEPTLATTKASSTEPTPATTKTSSTEPTPVTTKASSTEPTPTPASAAAVVHKMNGVATKAAATAADEQQTPAAAAGEKEAAVPPQANGSAAAV